MKNKRYILALSAFVAIGLLVAGFASPKDLLGTVRIAKPVVSRNINTPSVIKKSVPAQSIAIQKKLSVPNGKATVNENQQSFRLSAVQVSQLNSGIGRLIERNTFKSGKFKRPIDLGNDISGVVIDNKGVVVDILFVPSVFDMATNLDPLHGTGLTPEDLFNIGVVEAGSFSSDFYLPDDNTVTGGASDSEGGYWWNVDTNGDGSVDASVHTHGDPDDGASTGDTISYGNSAGDSESGAMYSNNDGVWTAYDDDDIDNDGIGNTPDQDMDGDGIADGQDPDRDGDGALNEHDDEPNNPHQGSSPSENGRGFQNTNYDSDGDGTSDENDTDMDGDGVPNHEDSDTDGDGISNEQDSDDDGDGTPDSQDATPRGKICVGCSAPGSRTSFIEGIPSVDNVFNIHLFDNIGDVVDMNSYMYGGTVISNQITRP